MKTTERERENFLDRVYLQALISLREIGKFDKYLICIKLPKIKSRTFLRTRQILRLHLKFKWIFSSSKKWFKASLHFFFFSLIYVIKKRCERRGLKRAYCVLFVQAKKKRSLVAFAKTQTAWFFDAIDDFRHHRQNCAVFLAKFLVLVTRVSEVPDARAAWLH